MTTNQLQKNILNFLKFQAQCNLGFLKQNGQVHCVHEIWIDQNLLHGDNQIHQLIHYQVLGPDILFFVSEDIRLR